MRKHRLFTIATAFALVLGLALSMDFAGRRTEHAAAAQTATPQSLMTLYQQTGIDRVFAYEQNAGEFMAERRDSAGDPLFEMYFNNGAFDGDISDYLLTGQLSGTVLALLCDFIPEENTSLATWSGGVNAYAYKHNNLQPTDVVLLEFSGDMADSRGRALSIARAYVRRGGVNYPLVPYGSDGLHYIIPYGVISEQVAADGDGNFFRCVRKSSKLVDQLYIYNDTVVGTFRGVEPLTYTDFSDGFAMQSVMSALGFDESNDSVTGWYIPFLNLYCARNEMDESLSTLPELTESVAIYVVTEQHDPREQFDWSANAEISQYDNFAGFYYDEEYTYPYNGEDGNAYKTHAKLLTTLPPDPVKEGYTFVGWYLDAALTEPYDGRPITSDLTLYAKFVSNTYTITFEPGGGTALDPVTADYNTTPEIPTPTRTGYTFAGWFTDAALSVAYTPGPVTADFTLYAKWTINTYTVTFDTRGGTAVDPVTVDYGAAVPLSAPTRTGFRFLGWYTNSNVLYTDAPVTGDLQLIAHWETLTYTVTFIVDGEVYKTIRVAHGTTLKEVEQAQNVSVLSAALADGSMPEYVGDQLILTADAVLEVKPLPTVKPSDGPDWAAYMPYIALGVALLCAVCLLAVARRA